MSIFRTLTILVLVGLILGGAAFFAYELYWKPQKLDREDKVTSAESIPAPPPDFSLAVYEKILALQNSGDRDGSRAALAEFIRNHPDSPKTADARAALGALNAARVFSPAESTAQTAYTVAAGDSLVKIAAKFKTNAELIFRVNNLETINLKVGQQLFIPKLDTSITVDRKAGTVTIYDRNEFFKEYAASSVKIPGGAGAVKTRVTDKVALQGANRVAFGDKNYTGSERWLMLGVSGVVIRGSPAAEGPAPAGIILPPSDMEEIFLLVSRGAPVTIN